MNFTVDASVETFPISKVVIGNVYLYRDLETAASVLFIGSLKL